MEGMTRNELILSLQPYVERTVNRWLESPKYRRYRRLAEDLRAHAMLWTVEGVDAFSGESLRDLRTFILYRIKGAFHDLIRAEFAVQNPKVALRSTNLQQAAEDLDSLPAPQEVGDATDLQQELLGLCNTEFERILWAMTTAGRTTAQIARELEVCPTTVWKYRQRLRRRFQKHLRR